MSFFKSVLRRHDGVNVDRHLALRGAGGIFVMPKFSHLMMDNGLIEVTIPSDYYSINKEAIDEMSRQTKLFICNLTERV